DPGATPADPGATPADPGATPADPGATPADPGATPADPGMGFNSDRGDEDYDSHIRTTTDKIPSRQQCAGCGLTATNGISAITLAWTPPETGGALTYNIYRCVGVACI